MNLEKQGEMIVIRPTPVDRQIQPYEAHLLPTLGQLNNDRINGSYKRFLVGCGAFTVATASLIALASILRPQQQQPIIIKQDPVPVVTPSPPQVKVQESCTQWCFSN